MQHKWIPELLTEIARYAEANHLFEIKTGIEVAIEVVLEEIEDKSSLETDNVVDLPMSFFRRKPFSE